jgi:xylulokinase
MYLGLDFSTQSAKATVIDEKGKILLEVRVIYDDLNYKTVDGVHTSGSVVTAPTIMFVEALDKLLLKIQSSGLDVSQVRAVSGCAQQHGSVYWKSNIEDLDMNHEIPLAEILKDAFSISESPVWQDSSTGSYCTELEELMATLYQCDDGANLLAKLTGSRAFERFTASQIAKISRCSPDEYNNTCNISLISNFLASLLCGKLVPLDYSDASGMNLMVLIS